MRKKLLKNRQALGSKEVDLNSRQIIERVLGLVEWEEINILHIYKPIISKKEVDTSSLIDWIHANHPEIEIIFAPSKKPFYLPKDENYDLVIVPVLGFDRSGNRLGYGGGYYDRLLGQNKCKQVIGLSYSFCEVDKLPAETHDQKLDKIITEKEIIDR
ncbi:5-formyltetrahydrofolate cyclo-ligase [Candidatus Saccharibacteria bacterium]|nr:5-formyltetrahydrofolate cyclo-ligase [Candidatus Saccharibacteria bacterium]